MFHRYLVKILVYENENASTSERILPHCIVCLAGMMQRSQKLPYIIVNFLEPCCSYVGLAMDFSIDGQISSFYPDQPEAMLLTLILCYTNSLNLCKTLRKYLFRHAKGKSMVNFYIVNALGQNLANSESILQIMHTVNANSF